MNSLKRKFCEDYFWTPFNYAVKYYHNRTAVFGYKPKDSMYFKLDSKNIQCQQTESQLFQLINAYREHGHKCANINPVDFSTKKRPVPELDPLRYGLTDDRTYNLYTLLSSSRNEGSLTEVLEFLTKVYCGNIGAEFCYLQEEEERVWFATRLEQLVNTPINKDFERKVGLEMLKCQAFDHFMAKKFVSLKRYGAEGAESMMAFFLQFLKSSVEGGVTELIIGMPHRGRLNLLINLFQLPPELLFRKLSGKSEFPDTAKASGDVISHLISNTEMDIDGVPLQVTTLHNPSHLEAVNPVCVGKTRCRHLELGEGEYGTGNWSDKVLNLQVHGDGAITGQGINQETLFMSRIPHFEVGGSVHLIVNNQVAFTTPPERGRGTPYCSDIAKIIAAPVVHVNGNMPEDVIRATQLVTEYQRKFRKDVFFDLNCFRLRGHNELDDPTFTNPKLYEVIKSQRTVPDQYAARLKEAGILSEADVDQTIADYTAWLNSCNHHADQYSPPESYFRLQWRGFTQAPSAITVWDTGCDINLLRYIATRSVSCPEHFKVHPTLLKNHINGRLKKINEGHDIDWSTAEAMAWGSLLYEGYNVRISGQDVGRGTFSHRHAMLIDQDTNDLHIPLNNLAESQATFLEVEDTKDSVWLVQVVVGNSEPLLDDYTWRIVRNYVAPFSIRTGLFDCKLDRRLCKSKGWNEPLLLLAMPKGSTPKDKVVIRTCTYTRPQQIINWMSEQLSIRVHKLSGVEELGEWFMEEQGGLNTTALDSLRDVKVLLLTHILHPPLFLAALSIKFTGRIKFGMMTVKKEDEGAVRQKLKQQLRTPSYLVITPERTLVYGQKHGQHFNFWAMNALLRAIQPDANDVFLCSLIIANMIALLQIVQVGATSWWKHLVGGVWTFVSYNLWLFATWLVILGTCRWPIFSTACDQLLVLVRSVALTDLGNNFRNDVLLLYKHPLLFILTFLLFVFMTKRYISSSQSERDSEDRPWWEVLPLDCLFRRPIASLSRPLPPTEIQLEDGIELLIERLAVPNLWLQPSVVVNDYIKDLPVWRHQASTEADNESERIMNLMDGDNHCKYDSSSEESVEKDDFPNCPVKGMLPISSCAICLDSYHNNSLLCGLPCGHSYHNKCIQVWLQTDNHHCPICRWPVYKNNHPRFKPRQD